MSVIQLMTFQSISEMKANSKEQLCLPTLKKTALATAIIATAATGFTSVAAAAERSELTIHLKSSPLSYVTLTHT